MSEYWDISSEESVDGLVVKQTNPFYPNINAKYSAEGALEGYDVIFNQGYIFNRVSESQVSDIAGICKISEMEKTWELPSDGNKEYYVEVVVSSENFLITSATFIEKEAGEAVVTEFPAIIFDHDDSKAETYTALFPICHLKNGSVIRYTQRNNIFLSDRQFKQLGGDPEATDSNEAHVLVESGHNEESNPVRVRAVKGDGDIEVRQDGDYIIVSGSSEGSGWYGENVGEEGGDVYVDGSEGTEFNKAQFRTLVESENIDITQTAGGGLEIKSEDINCSSSAGWNAYVDGTTNPAKFRGLSAGIGISFSSDDECVTTISRICCDLQDTTSVGAFTTYESTYGHSSVIGSSPLSVVTKPSSQNGISIYANGDTTYEIIELKEDGSDNGVIQVNDTAGVSAAYISATPNGENYFKNPTAFGTTSVDPNYSLKIRGKAKIVDSSDPTRGKLQLGDSDQDTVEIDGNGEFKFGIGVSSIESNQNDTIHVFSETSATYSAIGASLVYNSPATGSAILGGSGNYISGNFDVIVAGIENSISGGFYNFIGAGSGVDIIDSDYSSSVGGKNNDISGSDYAVIGGGRDNSIEDSLHATIAGGFLNTIEGALASVIGGGQGNEVFDKSSAILGGESNTIKLKPTNGGYSFIGAGVSNVISGSNSSIIGGNNNTISGSRSTTLGGSWQDIGANDAVTAGNYSKVQPTHHGAFVFSDSTTTPSLSSGTNSMVMDFANGVYVQTDDGLYVNGNPVMTGINPYDEDTLQSVTNRGATSTNAISVTNTITANQVLGTGIGNRITNNNVPYLLSGDSPAETQTLQDVTDNGSTTTRAITVGAFSATGTANISGILSIPNGRAVASNDVYYIVKLTQAEYDAITPDASTMYIITDEDFNSPVINPIKTVVSNYTITDTDYTILVSGSSAVNIALPSAAINSNYVYNIKNITTNSVVVAPSAGHIDGNTSKTINQKFESIATQSDGSNWYII
jgi:hypothetical protein